ncbi:MAG: hypothetical protein ACYSW6_09075 [Planctomycetota bacterium]
MDLRFVTSVDDEEERQVIVEFGRALSPEWFENWRGTFDQYAYTHEDLAHQLTYSYDTRQMRHGFLLEGFGTAIQLDRNLWLIEIWDSENETWGGKPELVSYAIVTGLY